MILRGWAFSPASFFAGGPAAPSACFIEADMSMT
jgi:hypothetical protein